MTASAPTTHAAKQPPQQQLATVEYAGRPARFFGDECRAEHEEHRSRTRRGKEDKTDQEYDTSRPRHQDLARETATAVPAPAILESPTGLPVLEIAPALFKLLEHLKKDPRAF
jgi:hypothetical protein